jgi:hypothetical protein
MQFLHNFQTHTAYLVQKSLACSGLLLYDLAVPLRLPLSSRYHIYPVSSTFLGSFCRYLRYNPRKSRSFHQNHVATNLPEYAICSTKYEHLYEAGTKRSASLPSVIVISSSRTFLSSPLKIGLNGSSFSSDAAIIVRTSSVSTRTVPSRS